MKKVTAKQVKSLLIRNEAVPLINVLPEEQHRRKHVPGSISIPLEKDSFLGRVDRVVEGKRAKVVVYDADAQCNASSEAAELLEDAGFENVHEFEGGIEEWQKAGFAVDGEEAEGPGSFYKGGEGPAGAPGEQDRKVAESVEQALVDSARAYASAAERADWEYLEGVLREIASRRERFAEAVRKPSREGDGGPSVLGVLREWWMAVRDRLSVDQYGLLAELERAEDGLLEQYRAALAADDLSGRLREALEEQQTEVQSTHDRIRELRDAEKAARQA
jgi:uncharacterized protein (TIGR02284 family)